MLEVVGGGGDRLHLVSAKVTALATELLRGSGVERLARARHEDYVRRELERGVTVEQNPSLRGWDELPESLKESNRRFAESLGTVIADIGGTLQPLADGDAAADLELPLDKLDQLARTEHERWLRSLEADGWTLTSGPKDPDNKRHPLLVPWEELTEAEREKDRDAYRGLPGLLATLGYGLRV